MTRTIMMTALAGAFSIGLATAALAVTGEFNNMCAEGLALHKNIKTDCSINSSFKGKTYCFSSQDAKANFMKNPTSSLGKAESFYKSEHKG